MGLDYLYSINARHEKWLATGFTIPSIDGARTQTQNGMVKILDANQSPEKVLFDAKSWISDELGLGSLFPT